jgi:hypothetical protein
MSPEEIERLKRLISSELGYGTKDGYSLAELCRTAHAAHEYKAENEKLRAELKESQQWEAHYREKARRCF